MDERKYNNNHSANVVCANRIQRRMLVGIGATPQGLGGTYEQTRYHTIR